MTVEKITLMEAYIIENLRNSGVTNTELLQVNDALISQWEKDHENFDLKLLLALAKDQKRFESIIEEGYQIKFLTFNGLMNLLRLKFSKVSEKDYDQVEQGIENLHVTEEQLSVLKGMLSPNWIITKAEGSQARIAIKQANEPAHKSFK